MTARSQGSESEAGEETAAVTKKEHFEGQGDGHVEQEAEGPPHLQALGDTPSSCTEEELWTRGLGVDTASGGMEAEAAEVASIREELWKMYPKRRHISTDTDDFVKRLLRIGLTKPQVCRMFRMNNTLFARSSKDLLERWKMLARHGVSTAGFRELLQRNTWWLSKSLQEVESTILYMERLVGEPGEAAARVFTVYPEILSLSEANLEEKAQALLREGVRDLARVVTKFPSVLSLHTAQDITNKMAALKEALGAEVATGLLERSARVLRASTAALGELLAWLEITFGRAAMLRMVEKQPAVTGTKVETAIATYARLVGTFGEARARRMLLVNPSLLPCKWCTLEAKVDFLTKELRHTLDEVASCPSVLNLSLEGRMRPRAAALKAAGKTYSKPSSLLKCSDKEFEQAYGVCLRQAVGSSFEPEASQEIHEAGKPRYHSAR